MSRLSPSLEKLFEILLHLYPAEFRRKFGEEMTAVFKESLQDSQAAGPIDQVVCLLLEALTLPGCLVQLYGQRLFSREEKLSSPIPIQSGPGSLSAVYGKPDSSATRREYILVVLPPILVGILLSFSGLVLLTGIIPAGNPLLNEINNGVAIAILLLITGFCVYAWRKGWPRWAGSWISYVILTLAILAYSVLATIQISPAFNSAGRATLQAFSPLLLAYALYRITRHDFYQGMMAVLPIAGLTWTISNLEFVPIDIKTAILMLTWLSLGLGTVCILALSRRGANPGAVLALTLAFNAAIGLPYAWAGIYLGGTLPSSAPGPSVVEVFKVYLPQMLGTSALISGPILACLLRNLGRAAGKLGRLGYRVALFGVVLLLLAAALGTEFGMSDGFNSALFSDVCNGLTVGGILIFSIGSALLLWAAHKLGKVPAKLKTFVLMVITLCLPFLFFLLSPVYNSRLVMDFSPLIIKQVPQMLLFSGGAAWVAITIWLATGLNKIQGPS